MGHVLGLGDAGQLRQVNHNLFKNAIEATEKQSVRILEVFTDAAHNTAGQINGVRLVVRDNGPGFEPAMMARVSASGGSRSRGWSRAAPALTRSRMTDVISSA